MLSDGEDDDDTRHRAFTILYGTQSGNARDVAERIARQARRRHIGARVYAMDEYDITDLINETLVVFILSTTGNGDFPAQARPFWRFLLRSDLPSDILADMTFATFGLGDSSYQRFCWPVRKMNKRLRGLGARELVASGEADDQHFLGIDGALRPWLDVLWTALQEVLPPLPPGSEVVPDDVLLPPTIEVRQSSGMRKGEGANGSAADLEPGWRWAQVTTNERITSADHWQDVRLLAFQDVDGTTIDYRPTDVLSVVPENAAVDVQHILDRMGWSASADVNLTLCTNGDDVRIPPRLASQRPLTLRRLLTAYLDFKSVPRPSFFERILPFTPTDHMQHEKLQEYCTPGEGADDMYEYAIRVRRTIMEVLDEFDAVAVPIAYALEVFPPVQPREFSIASSPGRHGAEVQLAVAVVDYKTRLKTRRVGVCTSWLARLQAGTRVPISILSSAMATDALRNHSAPAIFVGPGTGVAPIRSALWSRFEQQRDAGNESTMRAEDNICFFGCRDRGKDYLFAQEWKTLTDQGCITLYLAASREQADRVYVQDLVRQRQDVVWRTVSQPHALVYVCGSAGKMPQAVRLAVTEVCELQGGLTADDAASLVDRMEQEGRWIEECWD